MSPRLPRCLIACCITVTCSSAVRVVGEPRRHPREAASESQRKKNFFVLGLRPKPRDFTLSGPEWTLQSTAENGNGFRRSRPFQPWIGAQVASLRCLILRPGPDSLILKEKS